MPGRAMVFHRDPRDRELVADTLSSRGWWVETRADCDFPSVLSEHVAEVVFLDRSLVDSEGLAALDGSAFGHPCPSIILLGAREHAEQASEDMRSGVFHFLARPLASNDVCHWAEKALRFTVLPDQAVPVRLRGPRGERTCHVVCRSPKMQALRQTVLRVAQAPNATVLVLGETGTGKEIIARAIHQHSPREGPLVALSCPAIPQGLFESELFGHERGSFTGAGGTKRGLAEIASGGTLFLDEIGDMPLDLQAKLLRVLQERVIRKVGGTKDIPVDIRVVAATGRDLRRAVREGKFREDLFYRLTAIPLSIPPLRERREDIMPLTRTFLSEYCRDINVLVPHLRPRVENALVQHRWPGNVRELQNWAQRTALQELAPQAPWEWPNACGEELPCCLQDSSAERPEALTPGCGQAEEVLEPGVSGAPSTQWGTGEMGCVWPAALRTEALAAEEGITLQLGRCSVDEAERAVIGRALQETGGNKRKAAEMLGMNRATLYRKLARFGWRSRLPARAGNRPDA